MFFPIGAHECIVNENSECLTIACSDGAKPQPSKPEPLSFAARAAAQQQQQQPEKPQAPIAPEEVKQLVAGNKEIAAGKEAAVQAELEAARLRTQLGLDERIALFKKMLADKNISVFSTFEKVSSCSPQIYYSFPRKLI